MNRKGLLTMSAALILVGVLVSCSFRSIKSNDEADGINEDGVVKSYIYGTMDEYLAAPSTQAKAGSYSQKLVTVAAIPESGGFVTPSSNVAEGSTITLTAVPASGFKFAGWQDINGNLLSASSSFVTPSVTSDVTYKARFVKESYVVTAEAALSENGIIRNTREAGVVTGGGTLSDSSDKIMLTRSEPTQGYAFDSWRTDKETFSDLTKESITVGLTGSGADIEIDPDDYTDSDPVIYAVYKEDLTSDNNYIVTLAMTPAMGHVEFNSTGGWIDTIRGPSSTSIRGSEFSAKPYIRWRCSDIDTNLHGGGTKVTYEYWFWDIIVEYDTANGVKRSRIVSSTPNIDFKEDRGDGYCNLKKFMNEEKIKSFINVYIIYRAYDAAYEQEHILLTVPRPAEYGTTSGDMSSGTSFTTSVKATPHEGYEFDHWQWNDNGRIRTSKDNPMNISIVGQMTCIAYFTEATYNVSIASMSPAGSGVVKTGLGRYHYKDTVSVNIVPNEGYEFKSCSYTTANGVAHTSERPIFSIPEIKEDIFLNIDFKQTGFTVSAKPEPVGSSGDGYNKVKISNGTLTNESTDTVTSVEMPLDSAGSVILEAMANTAAGYKFDKWVGTDGSVSTDNPYTPSNITEDVTYIAKFVKGKYKISVSADPPSNGAAYVYDGSGTATVSSNALSQLDVEIGGSAVIKAVERKDSGYKFLYWTDQSGTKLYKDEIQITDIRADDSFVAHFTTDIMITVASSPDKAGILSLSSNGISETTEEKKEFSLKGGSDITLSAEPSEPAKYRFVRWQDSSGHTYTGKTIQVVNVTQSDIFTAVFEPIRCTVSVKAEPADGGEVEVKGRSGRFIQGSDEVDIGGEVELRARPKDGYTFLYWTSSSGTRYNGNTGLSGYNTLSIENVGSDETFTAHFGKEKVTLNVHTTPDGTGRVKADGTYDGLQVSTTDHDINDFRVDGRTNVVLTAYSEDENKYKFASWVDSKGKTYSTNPLELVDVTEDETYTAVFTSIDAVNSITVKASPPEGGKVQKRVNTNGTTTIIATPNDGYYFMYWMTSQGTKITSGTADISSVGWDEVYTAYFGRTQVNINASVSPQGAGTLKAAGTEGGSSKRATGTSVDNFTVDGGSNVTLTAYSEDENIYKFVKWVDSKGNSYNVNPLELVDVTADETYTAIFSSIGDANNITVKASPPEGGTVSKIVDPDGTTTINAEANDGFTFMYWQSSTGTRMTDAKVTLAAVGWDEVFTAYFRQNNVEVTVDMTPQGAGTVELNGNGHVDVRTTYAVEGGSNIMLKARSNDASKHKFLKWQDSKGNFYTDNPLSVVNITASETFTAIFEGMEKETGITVKASPPSGGRVSLKKNSDGTYTLSAQANAGYKFRDWQRNGSYLAGNGTYTFADYRDKDVYIAYFDMDEDYDARSDIGREQYPVKDRIYVAPNYTVTKATMQADASSQIATDKAEIGNSTPGSRNYGAYASVREYNEEKYSSLNDRSALLMDEELMTTDSQVIEVISVDYPDAENMAVRYTSDKFGSRYKSRILTIKQVRASAELASGQHTFLLRDTGAEYQDNVYILYGSENGRRSGSGIEGFDCVTCVADADGVLRFTIPEFSPNDLFIVVLTWPE